MPTTYIIGHKNPDLDSICSAIAYANFKALTGHKQVVAARCGHTNSRIDAVLKHFQVEPPLLVTNVTPRIKDIMTQEVHALTMNATCFQALEMIDQYDVRALPVLDEEGTVLGMVSIFDLGQYFVPKPRETSLLRRVNTTVSHIVGALKATIHHLAHPDDHEELFVRVASMDLRSFDESKNDIPVDKAIIIVGDRLDIQQKAIEMGVRLLVLTGEHNPSAAIIEAAKAHNVSLVTSMYDSATTAWIIRAAEGVLPLMGDEVIKCTPEEKVASAHHKIANSMASTAVVVDEDDQLVGIVSKGDLVKPAPYQLILIDHNELSQAVDGASDVPIVEILDHHRLGNPPTQQPITFRNEPVGSSCTLVAELFRQNALVPTPSMAGLMMSGIVSDTLNLKGPTTTPRDVTILSWLSEIACMTGDAISGIIFSSGSLIASSLPYESVRSDCKMYEEKGVRYAVSQVEEMGFGAFWERADALLEALSQFVQSEKLFFAALLVTDIPTQNSFLVIKGDPSFLQRIRLNPTSKDGIFDMPGVVSRKKQLIPFLSGLL
jgi:manganese-dependent inorganic pyrophosphatase